VVKIDSRVPRIEFKLMSVREDLCQTQDAGPFTLQELGIG
jgi:hypothetical protein